MLYKTLLTYNTHQVGITDFSDIKLICEAIRTLAAQTPPDYYRSISKPKADPEHELWILKSRTGPVASSLSLRDVTAMNNIKGKRVVQL